MTDNPDFDDDDEFPEDEDLGEVGDVEEPPEQDEPGPFELDTIELAPGVFATIYVEPGTIYDPTQVDLTDLYAALGVEPEEIIPGPIPDDFDRDNPDIRGPFHDLESLINFMRETGLGDFGDAFFDTESGEFFFEITGTE